MSELFETPTQSQEIGKLALALSKAQGELNGAAKDSENPFFKSKYADLYQCIQAAKDALTKNELAVIQTSQDSPNGITIVTTLAHSSGQWMRGFLTMKPKKDDDQGRGSSITYGRRYAFAAIVGLAQKDDDANESSGKSTNHVDETDTIDKLQEEADKNDTTVESLEKWYKSKPTQMALGKLTEPSRKKVNSYVTQLKESVLEDTRKIIQGA